MDGSTRLTLLTASFGDTQMLRTESLVEVATHLGHEVTVVSTQPGEVLPSLADHAVARHLRHVTEPELEELVADGTDLLVAVKALQVSLGLGHRVSRRTGTPMLLDIDDPDLEVRTVSSGRDHRESARLMWRDRALLPSHLRLAVTARRTPSTVSNPVLQRRWGGTVLPHARVDPGDGAAHVSDVPQVAFVGTTRAHKGLPLLREAVARLADQGWRLLVTADAPPDSRPWETWVGPLDGSLDAAALTAACDVVVIPSEAMGYGSAQLPLKLVDAMLMGRAVVVSDVGPLPWAVGSAGDVFRSGSVEDLVRVLRPLADPTVRGERGRSSRELAIGRYTVQAVAPAFARAVGGVLSQPEAGADQHP